MKPICLILRSPGRCSDINQCIRFCRISRVSQPRWWLLRAAALGDWATSAASLPRSRGPARSSGLVPGRRACCDRSHDPAHRPAGHVEGAHTRLGGGRVHVLRADPRDEPIAIDAGGRWPPIMKATPPNIVRSLTPATCRRQARARSASSSSNAMLWIVEPGQASRRARAAGRAQGRGQLRPCHHRPGSREKSLDAAYTESNARICH